MGSHTSSLGQTLTQYQEQIAYRIGHMHEVSEEVMARDLSSLGLSGGVDAEEETDPQSAPQRRLQWLYVMSRLHTLLTSFLLTPPCLAAAETVAPNAAPFFSDPLAHDDGPGDHYSMRARPRQGRDQQPRAAAEGRRSSAGSTAAVPHASPARPEPPTRLATAAAPVVAPAPPVVDEWAELQQTFRQISEAPFMRLGLEALQAHPDFLSRFRQTLDSASQ